MTTATQKSTARTAAKKRSPAKRTSTSSVTAQKASAKKATVRRTSTTKAVKALATSQAPIKIKKPKLVRDSFTIPKDEYVVIDSLKARASKLGQTVKKSELLRAGIKALATMRDAQFKAALGNVPPIKTGRPKKAK